MKLSDNPDLRILEQPSNQVPGKRVEQLVGLVLCVAVLSAGIIQNLIQNRPVYAMSFAPKWISIAAACMATVSLRVLRSGYLVYSTAAGFSGLLPPVPQPGLISYEVPAQH